MTLLANAFALLGLRGLVGALLGAGLAALLAYPLGRHVEHVAADERVERRVAELNLRMMRNFDARIEAALRARRSVGHVGDRSGDGGMPDDGYRRD